MFGSRWECDSCLSGHRRQDYICVRRGGDAEQALRRLEAGQQHPNLLAKYDYAGVCPRTMVRSVPAGFIQSVPWYDKGALGIPFHRVPQWYKDSISIFETARNQALEARSKESATKGK